MTYSEAVYLEIMKFQIIYPNIGDSLDPVHPQHIRARAFLELVKEYTLPIVKKVYTHVNSSSVTGADYPGSDVGLTPAQETRIIERILQEDHPTVYKLILKYPSLRGAYPRHLGQILRTIHASQK